MSTGTHIPWNEKPKNGETSFFTEGTFNKWLSTDTHESRLEERLARIGINPPPRLTGPIFTCKETSTAFDYKDRQAIKQETDHGPIKDQVTLKGLGSEDNNTNIRPEAKIKAELHAFNSQSGFSPAQTCKPSFNPDLNKETKSKASLDSSNKVIDHVQLYDKDIAKVNKEHHPEVRNDSVEVGDIEEEFVEKTKVELDATDTGEQIADEYESNRDMVAENVKPFSFYKEGREEDYKVEESCDNDDGGTAAVEAVTNNDTKTSSNSLEINAVEKGDTVDTIDIVEEELTEEQLKELQAQKEEEERKAQTDLNRKDKMFFNKKDRQATKYFPDIYNRKPRYRRSRLTCQEQKLFNDLARCYGHLGNNSTEICDENFKKYIAMKVIVDKEQELFQKYLKSISISCNKDYAYIHPEVEKYAATRFMVKKQECFKYPRFYSVMDRIILTDDVPKPAPTLQYIRPLLKLGSVCKLVLPNIVHGLPQPCVTTNFNKINTICPILKPVYKGKSVPVWNKVACSMDTNAEQLAVPNKCDVVMSPSAVRRLMDNQGKILKYWDMPFTVREYQVKDGDKTTLHKVVYIDKPFIRQSQCIPKDRIQLYQKHAIRACAIRANVRGLLLSGIKPVHEIVKSQTLEEVEQEVANHEKVIKESVKTVDNFKAAGDEVEHSETKSRKRKHVKGGMFDLEKDIDDLETFGMETFLNERSKVKVSGNSLEGKVNMCTEKVEVDGKRAKKGRKSTEEDLEFLKNELKGIKTQAMIENAKHLEIIKDSHCVQDKVRTQSSETRKDETNADNDEKSNEMTMVLNDEVQCATVHDTGENTRIEDDINQPVSKLETNKVADLVAEDEQTSVMEGVDMDKEPETTEETMSENSDKVLRNTRKTKKDLLNVKNISSFSERLKQMSTIKSKLMHRNKDADGSSNLTMHKTRSRSKSLETMEISINISLNTAAINPRDTDEKGKTLSENVSDSDSEDEGLVIDVPLESLQKPRKDDKPKSPVMPMLDRIYDIPMKEENPPDSSESEFGSPQLVIAIDDLEESEEKPKDKKRRGMNDAVVMDVPKRITRSSLSRESLDSTQAGNQTLQSKKNELRRKSMTEVTKAGPAEITRGKKRGNQLVSTRSRSTSSEIIAPVVGTGPDSSSRRVTRRSTGSSVVTKEEEVTQPVPLKKGRGRPKKNVKLPVETGIKDQKSKESEDNSRDGSAVIEDKDTESDKSSVVNNEVDMMKGLVDDSDNDNDDDVSPIRNKAKVRKLDSDDEDYKNSSRDKIEKLENTHCSKQHSSSKKKNSKKPMSDSEERKIKEMAAALKKKMAEKKSDLEAKEKDHDKLINEENAKSEDVKVNRETYNKPDKVDNKKGDLSRLEGSKSKELELEGSKSTGNKSEGSILTGLRQDGSKLSGLEPEGGKLTCIEAEGVKSTGLDTGIDNILKLQDRIHSTGSTFKGSAVDVFKQEHGMTTCEFPVEDNITYHQWNLAGTNILIRCKYHGFISGQGLVHISPKIEYQPNFGFEQDNVSEICKNWISIYVRPDSTLVKPRINPFNSEIMMLENVPFNELIPPDSLFKPEQAFTDLQVILEKLKSLPVGQYLLKNNPRNDQFSILKTTDHEERGSFDLHLNNSSVMKCSTPSPIQWTPINPNLMLPHQRKMSFIPCTFFPKDAKVGNKNSKPRQQKFMKKKKGKKDK